MDVVKTLSIYRPLEDGPVVSFHFSVWKSNWGQPYNSECVSHCWLSLFALSKYRKTVGNITQPTQSCGDIAVDIS